MPLDQNDLAQISKLLEEREAHLPGMIKRISGEMIESKLPKEQPKPVEPAKPPEPVKPEAKLDDTARQLAELKQALVTKERDALLGKAVDAISWFDRDMALGALRSVAKFEDDGTAYVEVEKTYAGVKTKEKVGLDEAVKDLATKKPFLVNTGPARGGTDAGKGSGPKDTPVALPQSYNELLENPNTLAELLKTEEGKAHVKKLQSQPRK